MEHNGEVVREILLAIDGSTPDDEANYYLAVHKHIRERFDGEVSAPEVDSHFLLLIQTQFLYGRKNMAFFKDDIFWKVDGLSMRGSIFLDKIRDDDAWEKIKGIAREAPEGTISLAMLMETAAVVAGTLHNPLKFSQQ